MKQRCPQGMGLSGLPRCKSPALTGRCLKRFSIMMPRQSMALSVILTKVGCGVMTSLTGVVDGSSPFAINLLTTSNRQEKQKTTSTDECRPRV